MDAEQKRKHEAAQTAKIAASVNVKKRGYLEPPVNESSVEEPIDWSFWKAMRTVKLWQACALLFEVDPDTLRLHPQAWMNGPDSGPLFDAQCFPSAIIHTRFDKALRLAMDAVSYVEGPIFPKGQPHPRNSNEKDVLLSEVVAYFHSLSLEWLNVPVELQSLPTQCATTVQKAPPALKVLVTSAPTLKQQSQEIRIIELLKMQDYTPNSLQQRAAGKSGPKAEIRTLALAEPALFTVKTFDTAWQRLRDSGEIAGAE